MPKPTSPENAKGKGKTTNSKAAPSSQKSKKKSQKELLAKNVRTAFDIQFGNSEWLPSTLIQYGITCNLQDYNNLLRLSLITADLEEVKKLVEEEKVKLNDYTPAFELSSFHLAACKCIVR